MAWLVMWKHDYRWTRRVTALFILTLTVGMMPALPLAAQQPWVQNASRPYKISKGLQNRHIALWASHGRYYDQSRNEWRWQRPTLFGTNEDLFTQTIVVPYLIPMLENAGAVVFTPRERDWQRNEVIVDNDDHTQLFGYTEQGFRQPWRDAPQRGFAFHQGPYKDGENPFEAGTARMADATTSRTKYSMVSYQPQIPEAGRYAVYVSYQTVERSVDDAHYTVWHKGEKTEFLVNQQMGGSTWVYLGTFDFDKGCNEWNRVTLTNQSGHHGGLVTADAVRFGGGMGNIERGGSTSGLPRCLEGARYYCQWAGMPYEVYSSKAGQNDYADDINSRSLTGNLLAGSSARVPGIDGKRVPLELSLAVHSDAGYQRDGVSIYGPLAISTTISDRGDSVFLDGRPRLLSRSFASLILENANNDIRSRFGFSWKPRELRDRNYSETRLPEVPSAIFETMSHQSFPDMRYGQDPNFKFTLARSIYKSILQYINKVYDEDYAVTPLAPAQLRVEFTGKKGEVKLMWTPTEDTLEPTSQASGYVVYTAVGTGGFDNGTHVSSQQHTLRLQPGVLYSFRVTAMNRGGESFPSEVVSALYHPKAQQTILVVNGFHRLSSPDFIDNDSLQGFRLGEDIGVSYGRTAGWAGQQLCFNLAKMGIEDSTGLGFGRTELAGMFIAGNDMNYVHTHAEAISQAGHYNIASCGSDAIDLIHGDRYQAVDLILGLERNDGHSLLPYKTFTSQLQGWLRDYTRKGGAVLVSGCHVGSDMMAANEQLFLGEVLKCSYAGKDNNQSERVNGMGTSFTFYRTLNETHYAAQHPDILQAREGAIATMAYADGYGAAVGYRGTDCRTFTIGFPFECIKDAQVRTSVMQGILNYLIK